MCIGKNDVAGVRLTFQRSVIAAAFLFPLMGVLTLASSTFLFELFGQKSSTSVEVFVSLTSFFITHQKIASPKLTCKFLFEFAGHRVHCSSASRRVLYDDQYVHVSNANRTAYRLAGNHRNIFVNYSPQYVLIN